MANINSMKKGSEDPLDKLVKIASIGTSVASLASRAPGSKAAAESEPDTQAVSDTNYSDAMTRRMSKLKNPYV